MKTFDWAHSRFRSSFFLISLINLQGTNSVRLAVDDEFIQFEHFLADNTTMKCWADEHASPFNDQVRGVCMGGWLVLEPWITPSLFYQFLGGDEQTAAGDMYSFCKVLGPEEGNKQLRRHWDTWVTEDIIKELAEDGDVNSLRLPVGDWMYKPYGPYIGCTDGATDYVDKLLGWAETYGLSVLFDIHGVRGSQNGFDNSGQQMGFEWTSTINDYPKGLVTFEHWPIRTAEWMGTFNASSSSYISFNKDNVDHTIDVIRIIVDTYKDYPAVYGLEPVNEPWEYTPIEKLKRFYWEAYLIVKTSAPDWKFVMHDSFRLDPSIWGGFMSGCPDRAMDTHIYQAWNFPSSRDNFFMDACSQKYRIAEIENVFGPVIVGEWSLATDNCAMWLNGFNDNLSGYPMLPCKYVECPKPYMGTDQPGTPVDPSRPIQGPFGTGMSGPSWGMCPVDRDWSRETSRSGGNNYMHASAQAPPGFDDTDAVMEQLARKKLNAFSGIGHGFYFWNFRTELDEPQWNFLLAVKRGWLHPDNTKDEDVLDACNKEDKGEYKCALKQGMLEEDVRGGCMYILDARGTKNYESFMNNLTGDALFQEADTLYSEYWQNHRAQGATCDFGGTAELVELNSTFVSKSASPVSVVEAAEKPLLAILIGVGIIVFMSIFATIVFRMGGYAKEKNLKNLGAIRKSFRSFANVDNERGNLIA